jgi:hypothetical protein
MNVRKRSDWLEWRSLRKALASICRMRTLMAGGD